MKSVCFFLGSRKAVSNAWALPHTVNPKAKPIKCQRLQLGTLLCWGQLIVEPAKFRFGPRYRLDLPIKIAAALN